MKEDVILVYPHVVVIVHLVSVTPSLHSLVVVIIHFVSVTPSPHPLDVVLSVSVEYWAGTSLLNIVPRKGVVLSLY